MTSFDHIKWTHGQDARATADPAFVAKRRGAYLPHWTQESATYAVTFRLKDSIPQIKLQEWREASNALRRPDRPAPDFIEWDEAKLDTLLNSGYGCCLMRDDRIARPVADALNFFDADRYILIVWCVMPNHVHALLRPLAPHALPEILHSWKSFTATSINRLLNRQGDVWQAEYYDHIIRDQAELDHQVSYILNNPWKAGLEDWKWVGYVRRRVSSFSRSYQHDFPNVLTIFSTSRKVIA